MELLTIRHADFTITIECGKFDAILTKAKNNIGGGGDRSLSPFDFILNPPISNVSKKQDTDLSLVPLLTCPLSLLSPRTLSITGPTKREKCSLT